MFGEIRKCSAFVVEFELDPADISGIFAAAFLEIFDRDFSQCRSLRAGQFAEVEIWIAIWSRFHVIGHVGEADQGEFLQDALSGDFELRSHFGLRRRDRFCNAWSGEVLAAGLSGGFGAVARPDGGLRGIQVDQVFGDEALLLETQAHAFARFIRPRFACLLAIAMASPSGSPLASRSVAVLAAFVARAPLSL